MKPYKINSPRNGVDWMTPPEIIKVLGEFDLDPCCPPVMPWATAKTHYHSGVNDGLAEDWSGRVWLNPPYGKATDPWLAKMVQHGNGIALIPAATETARFSTYVWGHTSGICFISGRIRFYLPDGSRPPHSINQPCCLVAYGARNMEVLLSCGLGTVMEVKR